MTEDCCYQHSLQNSNSGRWLQNDGVIDWEAVDIMVAGIREVELTWVEAEIVVGTMLAHGGKHEDVLRRLGLHVNASRARYDAYQRVADALAAR